LGRHTTHGSSDPPGVLPHPCLTKTCRIITKGGKNGRGRHGVKHNRKGLGDILLRWSVRAILLWLTVWGLLLYTEREWMMRNFY
jgi:hypothetical protein